LRSAWADAIRGSKAVTIKSGLCTLALCLASGAALAQPAPLPAGPVAGLGPVMPPQEIVRILRADGFVPQATPVRNGEAYQVRAIDRYGRQVRVAVDARYGDLLMVRPIAMLPPGAYGPRPYGPPPGYYDNLPTGAVGAYPLPPGAEPSGRAAALTPAHPPIPRPKPVAKPAAVTPAPAPEAAPAEAAAPAPSAPPAAAAAPAATPAEKPSPPAGSAIPPVAPLE
jgi:pyruvate dehydrogenase E2 component (dihydrolipoamide acetyltransferase)